MGLVFNALLSYRSGVLIESVLDRPMIEDVDEINPEI